MSLAFFPKSLQNKFGFCLGSQRQLPKRDNTLYLWPRSKGWMRAVKRTFNLQRLKSQIQGIGFLGKRLLCCANQNFPLTFSQSFLCTRISYSIIWSGLFPKLPVRLLNVPSAGYIVCDKWSFVLYLYGIPSCSNCVRISLNFYISVPIQRLSEFKKLNIKIPSFLSFFVKTPTIELP